MFVPKVMPSRVAVLLAVIWIPRWVDTRAFGQAAVPAQPFLLVPSSGRPDGPGRLGQEVAAAANLLSAQRGASLVLHRPQHDHFVGVALTVDGRSELGGTAFPVHPILIGAPGIELLSQPTIFYARRRNSRGRASMAHDLASRAAAADWISAQHADGDERVSLSLTVEPAGKIGREPLRRCDPACAGRVDDTDGLGPGDAQLSQAPAMPPAPDSEAHS